MNTWTNGATEMTERQTTMKHFTRAGLAILLACAATRPARAENWPGWRGAQRTGVSAETNLPKQWSATEGVLWKTPTPGSGSSNPIVWEDQVLITSSDGARQEDLHVMSFNLNDGQQRWHARLWGTSPTLYFAGKSSMATPTPVTDGEHVFAFFGTGDVFCLDMQGKLVWHRSLAAEYGAFENRFAASSSPLVYEDMLILQCDHYGASYALAIDKLTGANRWKTDRPECWLSWSSPQLAPVESEGRHELLLSGSHKLDALDPRTGQRLWTLRGMSRECIPTPVLGDGLIYAVSGPNAQTFCIRPGGKGDVTETHVVWSSPRGAPFVPSGILVGQQYYLVDDKGVGTCLDAATGKVVWRKRFGGAFTASPVAGDGKIYFCDEAGNTIVAQAGPAYEELSRNAIDEPIYASPAISQGRIFLRTASHLMAIGSPP